MRMRRGMRLGMIVIAAWAHAASTIMIDIPNGDLDRSLLELGRQARISIVFPTDATDGLRSVDVDGEMTVEDALIALIGEHCLSYVRIHPTLYAVRGGCRGLAPLPEIYTPHPDSAPPRPDSAPQRLEEVLVMGRYVTGSRIRNPVREGATQVDIIDRSEIELTGSQAIGELLRYVPAVAGNSTSTLVSNGGDGTATVTLRGLPASNTLVLLNGRRTNPDGLFGRSVDLNTVPIGIVDRIEILKDGASAIYGSDAIAGVVNIITRADIDGLMVDSYYGQSGRGDLETFKTDVLWGRPFEDGQLTFGASYYDQRTLWSRDRPLSASADDRPRGGIDKRSSATTNARISLPLRTVILDEGDGSLPSQFREATGEDRFNYRDFTASIVPSQRWSVFGSLEGRVADSARGYAEILYTNTAAENTLAQTPLFTGFESMDLTVSADNPFNPFGQDIVDVRRRIVELPSRRHRNQSQTWRTVLGVSGDLSDVHWDLAFTQNRTDAREVFTNLLHAQRTQLALGPDCKAPCVPLNVFGPTGSITGEMLDYLGTGAAGTGRSDLRTGTLTIDFPMGTLPGGAVEVVSGLEYRDESLTTRPDALISGANTIGGVNYEPVRGNRDVWEAYLEVRLPLLADVSLVKLLTLSVAGRISQYSDFGRTTNPRVAIRYEPFDSLVLRASFSRGFRAPSLSELYATQATSFEQINDPCASASNVRVLPGCSMQSDPTLVQFLTLKGGNPDLSPERAKTRNVGIVWQPAESVTLTADYYRIRGRSVVDSSAQFIVNENARSGAFDDQVQRDAMGNINQIIADELNIGSRDVRGWDLTADLVIRLNAGRIKLTSNATNIRSFEDQFAPDTVPRDQAGTFSDEASSGNGALPDWKFNAGIDFSRGGWRLMYTWHYVGALEEEVPLLEQTRRIEPWSMHDLQFRYFGPATAWTTVSLGINNLFDEAPPFAAAAFNDSYDARTYDITGRFVYLQVRKAFND